MVNKLGRKLNEVPVGFKWFAPGLFDGTCCFVGEESRQTPAFFVATAACGPLTKTASSWTCWLPKSRRVTGSRIRVSIFAALVEEFGMPYYTRIDAPASPEQKARLGKLSPESVRESTLAGDPITAKLTRAPGNDAAIGGLKVTTASGWFAARPSGTENIYKIYAGESFGKSHLEKRSLPRHKQIGMDNALRWRAQPCRL